MKRNIGNPSAIQEKSGYLLRQRGNELLVGNPEVIRSSQDVHDRTVSLYPSPAQCRKNVIKEIDEEIRRLKREQEAHASIEASRTQLKILRRYVPNERALDWLLRYEAHLDRFFDRTQSRLERRQRMRLGQPVLPELKVRRSLS